MNTDDITTLAEQNRENIAAIAGVEGVDGQLAHDVDEDETDKLAAMLGGGSVTEKDDSDGELSDEERAMALLQQNAENLVTLAEELGVGSNEIAAEATEAGESKAFKNFTDALGGGSKEIQL
jgi:hypothetical protein